MAAPRFYFITNDVARAALEFSCHPGNLPSWLAVLDSLDDWLKIPDGAKCMALWYGTAAELEGWRNSWAIRKARGGIAGIDAGELDKIMAWAEEHRARPSARLLTAACAADDDRPIVTLTEASTVSVPPAAIVAEAAAPTRRSAKWT